MADANARSTTKPAGQPIHPMPAPISIACFAGAFVTDFVYWQTGAVIWESVSDWLITVGLIMAGFAIIAFVIDFIGGKQIRALSWPYAVGYALAVLLSL